MPPMATTVIAVCAVLLTIGVWVAIVALVMTLLQVRRTAKAFENLAERAGIEVLIHQARETLAGLRHAAEAVEVLAHQSSDTVSRVQRAAAVLGDLAANVRTGWLRVLGLAVGAASNIFAGKDKTAAPQGAGRD